MKKISTRICCFFAVLCLIGSLSFNLSDVFAKNSTAKTTSKSKTESTIKSEDQEFSLEDIPDYSDEPYVVINDNVPYFTKEDVTTTSYESYSELDEEGRCGVAIASIGEDLMPTEDRKPIGKIKPSGWHTVKYNDLIDGNYLYNRCHLIGFQLTAENANEKNLITGTRYLNTEGMLPFENMVADYIKETNNHVLYRVTPVFEEDDLVARGVRMEAQSVEDDGDGICFHVFCYNVQPGIIIDYASGESEVDKNYSPASTKEKTQNTSKSTTEEKSDTTVSSTSRDYVVNINTGKFHYPSCYSASTIKPKNRMDYSGNRDDLIAQGYDPCKNCNP